MSTYGKLNLFLINSIYCVFSSLEIYKNINKTHADKACFVECFLFQMIF